ncbi:UDP-N-acetylmuramoyl-L-alanine--D-glutamate ligase [Buchnera aphidicola (Muscaphis stroyani)]|uniref:UDP-N-acetylmuramoylalanine--D-glutamate ligase n=1 Tax=Buchnera aphidicola (Muscaphis stroyani) TaxID=1241869 RepID=A0A4D6YIP2_9GAMM|nr:UDP-N-acetylmuramoyl-L-alanine--D-glutamate ligase [Buchnera aphidicola]QCI24305.1 UDP-N-acetylmuramoyl-L-alanine--D-glutamate ligase [Buchnera aphidicola (Muscaphis stroyani)]
MSYNYFGKKILILGMGLTGISCINYFLKKGILPKIIDESHSPTFLNQIPKNIMYKIGNLEENWILESDLIIISPGISSFKPILKKARLMKIEIISDIELFAREAKYPIISITGTNGKSTVSTMVERIARNAGYKTALGGNIGLPVLNMLEKKSNLYIIELSSFQLETTFHLKSKIAVVLNISEDHINRYPEGYQQYKKIKTSVYNNADVCIINSNEILNISEKFSLKKYVSFGTKNSNYQIRYYRKKIFLCHKNKKIINTNQMLIKGHHNYINALVSIAICDQIKIDRNYSINTIKNFSNLPHRFQTIHFKNQIHWINDSKSTNVENTKVALKNLKIKGTIWLLLGGDSKSANFNSLKHFFKKLKIKIYCFGKDGNSLAKIYKKKSIYIKSLEQAVILISKKAIPGDVVLLSPGCSSLDQFSNFQERGEFFTKLVKEIS